MTIIPVHVILCMKIRINKKFSSHEIKFIYIQLILKKEIKRV